MVAVRCPKNFELKVALLHSKNPEASIGTEASGKAN